MPNLKLHIISFDVPFPADYGGVIDVYHKIRWLSMLGVQVHLHCFEYGRGVQPILNELCAEVTYHSRKSVFPALLKRRPFIVESRINKDLEKNLLNDDAPILCEGIHTAGILENPKFSGRKVAIRPTNIEHDYYHLLAEREKHLIKRLYFKSEAKKLRAYDAIHRRASHIFPVSNADQEYFAQQFPELSVQRIYPFHAMDGVDAKTGKGNYVLFHANLSVAENEEIARYILNKISEYSALEVKIAGKNPSESLVVLAREKHCELIPNPSDAEMTRLIEEAHIQLMFTFQPTGFKHKLLLSLFKGRFVLANAAMLQGSGMENLVHQAESTQDILQMIKTLAGQAFSQAHIDQRNQLMPDEHQNKAKVEELIKWVKE